MYAEDIELGFDPTIKAVKATDGVAQYEITVRDEAGGERIYRTTKVLSASGDNYLIGRATRVWEAVEIVDGVEVGDPVALKDCWVDSDRDREGYIIAQIRASPLSEKDQKDLNRVLITVPIHGDVLAEGIQDRTRPFPDIAPAPKRKTDKYQIHYRIVYLEVGIPLSSVTLLSDVYKALGDACVEIGRAHV